MAFDISQLFGQGAINRLMTSQLTGPQSTFTNQNAAPNAALPQPTAPAPLMQNVPGSLAPRPADAQPADPWSGMRQANAPSQQTLPDDLGDKLVRGLHNFANSSSGQWLNNMFTGWAQGSSPQDSLAKGGMSVANGATRNHTVDLLVKNGFDPQSAQAIAGTPDALNAALKTVMDRQNPDHQLQVQKTQAEINKINAEGLYYGKKGGGRYSNAGGGFIFDNITGKYVPHPDAAPNSGTTDQNSLPVVPLNDQGIPDEQAQKEFLDKLPPDQASMVKGIAEGRMDLGKVTSMKAGERQRVAGLVSRYDQTFDMSNAPARNATRKDYATGDMAKMSASTNLAIQHLSGMMGEAQKLNNTSYPMWNSVKNLYGSETGNPDMKSFETYRLGVADELGKAFHGVGAVPETQVNAWKDAISTSSSLDQLREVVRSAMHMLAARTETYNARYKNVMGRNAPDLLTPNSYEALKHMNIDPGELGISHSNQDGPKAGTVEDGHRFKGGAPGDQNNWEKL